MIFRRTTHGFTIVELLIVIVVIGILAAIVIVAYNGVQTRASNAKRESDLSLYSKAIQAARINSDKVLKDITVSTWSMGECTSATNNAAGVEPRNLPKSHTCWVTYYLNLARIGEAAGMSLTSLRSGDSRGNPYVLDENEGETSTCTGDILVYFNGNGVAATNWRVIPTSKC